MICEARAPEYQPVLINSRMRPSTGQPQPPYDYADCSSVPYSQQQQQQQHFRSDDGPSIVNTLEAPAYYQPLPNAPKHAPQQQSYYEPSSPAVTISQFSYALDQHKPIAAYQHQHHPQEPSEYCSPVVALKACTKPLEAMDQMCDVCRYPDPILVAPTCRHTFHSRCVHVWPIDACPVCAAPLDQVAIVPTIDMMTRPEPRSGKWTRHEENFIDVVLREFDRQALPLAHGTPIRLVLAKMLNCSTMRLSKKFQKNALGKRTFRVVKPVKGKKALEFDPMDHAQRQRELSQLELVFRQELIDQFQRENNTNEGALVETQCLRVAVQQFWVSNLLKFAVLVGQPVVGLDVSDAKKRKRAMQLLRNGQYDELLSWHHQPSSRGCIGMTSMPPPTSNDVHTGPTSWNTTSAAEYSSSVLGPMPQESGVYIPALVHQAERPVKKKRTPEADVDGGRFALPMDQPTACGLQYGRISPRSTTSISSLRRFKDEAKEVNAGMECGVLLADTNDIKPGDHLEVFETEERARTL